MQKYQKYILGILLFLIVVVSILIVLKLFENKKNIDNNSEERRDLGMYVEIMGQKYEVTLEDNDTVTEFKKLLPLELSLSELNGNEKYFYLDTTLPIREEKVMEIKAGDVMLYGDNCLVIFYQSFSTVYSYTKIGHIDNLPTLDKNTLNVKITLE